MAKWGVGWNFPPIRHQPLLLQHYRPTSSSRIYHLPSSGLAEFPTSTLTKGLGGDIHPPYKYNVADRLDHLQSVLKHLKSG
jgi:hypothetical protein